MPQKPSIAPPKNAAPKTAQRLCVLPLDRRPVCYDMPYFLVSAAGYEPSFPSKSLLGQLKEPANLTALSRWTKHHLTEGDGAIIALDTIAYGGLISSRVGQEPLETLEQRVAQFFETVSANPLYGFSSILRIPSYNNAQEEPDYWATYGEKLYQYSRMVHETNKTDRYFSPDIPQDILQDFIWRRQRNYSLNRNYIDYLDAGRMDYLVYGQDDTGAQGMNVQEANALRTRLKRKKRYANAQVMTGSDEIISCLIARWMSRNRLEPIRVYPFYSSEEGRHLEAKFDGVPIDQVVRQRIDLCGGVLVDGPEEADLWLLVHTPHYRQGDHCEKQEAVVEPFQVEQMLNVVSRALLNNRQIAIADVAYANGSDPKLALGLVYNFEDLTGLFGYGGWNTPGNTIGSVVAQAIVRLMAEENNQFQAEPFHWLLFSRFVDDWLYQADVRQVLRQDARFCNGRPPDADLLNSHLEAGIDLLYRRFGLKNPKAVQCSFPCRRTFEIAVEQPGFQLA